jgi:uncharacterized protein (TIGR03118 family)
MKMSLRFIASSALVLIAVTACFGQRYTRINLVSNSAGVARITDPQFISPWGMSRSPSSAWWVADQRTGFSTAYNGAGVKQSLSVFIPPCDPNNKSIPAGTPTGVIFNSEQTDFLLAAGKPAIFLFSTIDGTIAGWNPNVAVDQRTAAASTHAVTVVKTTDGSSYTGLTSAFIDGKRYLYAANFSNGRVDVYDNAFHQVRRSRDGPDSLTPGHCRRATRSGDCWNDQNYFSENSFVDESLPRPYTPFNVQAIGNNIVVTYAVRQEQVSPLEMDGPGLGFVDIYSSTGQLLLRLEHGDWLNAPWGVALAPLDFGRFSHNLLIGQFAGGGDTQSSGYIAAYDLTTGKFNGLLPDADGKPLAIKGVLALGSGNAGPNNSDSTAVSAAAVFFTAASSHGSGGLFGYVAAVSTVDRLAEASGLTPRSATNIHAHISSIPAGADIQVDGAYVGATPSDIELTCCWHDVTILKAGRTAWTRRVRFADRALKITAHLQK